ncbi:arylesterase [Ravibacter arvi]|uniref:Arylesterase n=1 Tax=Ravibacter arvi TaxID=2051041 RepID=A0ABP8LXX3_9BACT
MYKAISFWILSLLLLSWGCGQANRESEKQETTNAPADSPAHNRKTIVFFGNSLTAGYGLKITEAYPALIQARIDSLDLPYQVVNAGVSGETTASGNSRIDWILEKKLDVFFLELGGNDGLRGIPVAETEKNLQSIVDKVKARYPDAKIVLAGMQVPPNMGESYTKAFADIYPELAGRNKLYLVPFLLEKVGGERALNLADGIHPTAEGHRIVADNVWSVLQGIL